MNENFIWGIEINLVGRCTDNYNIVMLFSFYSYFIEMFDLYLVCVTKQIFKKKSLFMDNMFSYC